MYETMTVFIDDINTDDIGEVIIDKGHKGTMDSPIQMPWIRYSESVMKLTEAVYQFVDEHEEYNLHQYKDLLEKQGIQWRTESMRNADVSNLDGITIMALLVGIIRAERFCDGILLDFFKDGTIMLWLKRLKEIDETVVNE